MASDIGCGKPLPPQSCTVNSQTSSSYLFLILSFSSRSALYVNFYENEYFSVIGYIIIMNKPNNVFVVTGAVGI